MTPAAMRPPLDVDLPLLHGATSLVCTARVSEDRVKVRLVVARPGGVLNEFVMRVGVTFWRGVWLPALRHLASYNAIPLTLTVVEPSTAAPESKSPARAARFSAHPSA